ncbi:hypothetical protein [Cellulomonas fimi]|uniref:Uncharacterized protein n=1 Tax=Cellulomonas fimi (strain ATCC 484 / DSM 20113 / JCM 1341 / CCUG 24087 / LMG 16345 / NBRC 15513 / NCIMB 8980 / NCTC 7547 / NRS-133) TaxID=590998 RepID=F4GZZ0_CELFA|nr:hypothetical protein [Cellulomonas fimi]AEE44912.1 hypothetical protein Celf_0772 [Cellulomonas fimi ATCC 484]NNH08283.1 hypothetical protein [Cellulomonas fimi]VEH27659.1 Uncharacterised protein [Cellulomonas fimi]
MVRIVNESLAAGGGHLSVADRRRAARRLERRQAANPLRRVQLACEEHTQRDAVAVVGDHVWCDAHGDFSRVVHVVE